MKRFLLLLSALSLLACSAPHADDFPQVCAHRGCHLEGLVPENSVAGVEMAARYGYPSIELDVQYTLDSVMVVMHDRTINRTMRRAGDYAPVEEPVRVSETPFEELRARYVLASEDPALRTPIPTLEEMLEACRRCGIHPILHSYIDASYDLAARILGDDWTCFTISLDNVAHARAVSQCPVLLDPGKADADSCAAMLAPFGGGCGMSTMDYRMLDSAYIAVLHAHSLIAQSSIFPVPHDADAIRDGADIILSDFCWLQTDGRKPLFEQRYRAASLPSGGRLDYAWAQELEYGAIVLEVTYQGEASVTVDGWAHYTLHAAETDHFVVGLRNFREVPSFELVAGEGGCWVQSARLRIYEL